MYQYPPFAAMVRLVIRGPVEEAAGKFAADLAGRLSAALEARGAAARVLGAAPAPLARLRGYYRFQIQIQGPDGEKLRAAVRQVAADTPRSDDVQWIADVDPVDML
jgi:primosomal protein N' (replication factor Y)